MSTVTPSTLSTGRCASHTHHRGGRRQRSQRGLELNTTLRPMGKGAARHTPRIAARVCCALPVCCVHRTAPPPSLHKKTAPDFRRRRDALNVEFSLSLRRSARPPAEFQSPCGRCACGAHGCWPRRPRLCRGGKPSPSWRRSSAAVRRSACSPRGRLRWP